jgi:hypothetical protein
MIRVIKFSIQVNMHMEVMLSDSDQLYIKIFEDGNMNPYIMHSIIIRFTEAR